MKRGRVCAVHVHYSKVPQEDHHVWPLGYHGPDIATNKARVCANGHGDIHYYLELLLKTGLSDPIDANNKIPSDVRREFGERTKEVAMLGFIATIYGLAAVWPPYPKETPDEKPPPSYSPPPRQ